MHVDNRLWNAPIPGRYGRADRAWRVNVTVATGIPAEQVRAANLGYLDPGDVDLAAWAADPDALVVPDAGEELYRLR